MGCDIHNYVERKINGVWELVPDTYGPLDYMANYSDKYNRHAWSLPRSYNFFATLAGVRNYNELTPIHEPKGIPEDASEVLKKEWEQWQYDGHTPSFFSVKELLEAKDKMCVVVGFLDIEQYKKFKSNGKPDDWFISAPNHLRMSGKDIAVISNEEMDRIINLLSFLDGKEYYTECIWEQPYSSFCEYFWGEFLTAMQKLDEDPNNVRFVFWFDN
jgi:hypothetical protein